MCLCAKAPGEASAALAVLELCYIGISQGVVVERSPVCVREPEMSIGNIVFAKVRCSLLSTLCFACLRSPCLLQRSEWLGCHTKSSLSQAAFFHHDSAKHLKPQFLTSEFPSGPSAMKKTELHKLAPILTVQVTASMYTNLFVTLGLVEKCLQIN